MYVGLGNPNAIIPLKKMQIINTDKSFNNKYTVLYNPQSYQRTRSLNLIPTKIQGANGVKLQWLNVGGDTLSFELFFDSMSASTEVGDIVDRIRFGVNSLLPSPAKVIDVREESNKVFDLMLVDPKLHRPPIVEVAWDKLNFTGMLAQCEQRIIKFNEQGKAVRATLKCSFMEYLDDKLLFGMKPKESPDTTKYRRVSEGDSLWALASKEYGDSGKWRVIAGENGLANPRLLRSGDMIRVPALKE